MDHEGHTGHFDKIKELTRVVRVACYLMLLVNQDVFKHRKTKKNSIRRRKGTSRLVWLLAINMVEVMLSVLQSVFGFIAGEIHFDVM